MQTDIVGTVFYRTYMNNNTNIISSALQLDIKIFASLFYNQLYFDGSCISCHNCVGYH